MAPARRGVPHDRVHGRLCRGRYRSRQAGGAARPHARPARGRCWGLLRRRVVACLQGEGPALTQGKDKAHGTCMREARPLYTDRRWRDWRGSAGPCTSAEVDNPVGTNGRSRACTSEMRATPGVRVSLAEPGRLGPAVARRTGESGRPTCMSSGGVARRCWHAYEGQRPKNGRAGEIRPAIRRGMSVGALGQVDAAACVGGGGRARVCRRRPGVLVTPDDASDIRRVPGRTLAGGGRACR